MGCRPRQSGRAAEAGAGVRPSWPGGGGSEATLSWVPSTPTSSAVVPRVQGRAGLPLPLIPGAPSCGRCPVRCGSPVSVCPLQLVSDARRMSDVRWFQEAFGPVLQTVRVVASEQSRQQRGWVFTPGEPLTTLVPKAWSLHRPPPHPSTRPLAPVLRSSALPSRLWAARKGSEKGV